MKIYKLLSYVLAGIVLAVAAYNYLWLKDLGFPDGSITALDRARMPLYRAFIVLSLFCGAYLIYLGAATSEGRHKKQFIGVACLYLLITLVTAGVDRHFASYLPGGGGG